MTPQQQIEYPITDGFLLNTALHCNLAFGALAIAEYEALRRSSGFRSKSWCIPEDSSLPLVPAYDSYEYQVSMAPGSAIWGYLWTQNGNNNAYSVQVQDACTDVPLFSEVMGLIQQPTGSAHTRYLPKLLIVSSGLLNVTLCNLGSASLTGVQLVLMGGEPAS